MSIFSNLFSKDNPMDINSIISAIKAEIVKIKASPFLAQLESVALKIAQNAEPASLQNDIQLLAKIYAELKPVEDLLRTVLPQYAPLFDLLDQLLVAKN